MPTSALTTCAALWTSAIVGDTFGSMPSFEIKLARLMRRAKTQTLDEVLDRAGRRRGGSLSFAFAVQAQRTDREHLASFLV
jgi:hypothetical protein